MSISVPPSSATAARPDEGPCPSSGPSPRRLVWLRFRRDRSGVVAAVVVLCYILVALCAPIISSLYGKDPYTHYGQERPELLNEFGFPAGPHGGISGEFWLGLEPGLGRDVFMLLVYGIRTSLLIALAATVLTALIGVAVGVTAGYAGGRTDWLAGRVIDIVMSFPALLFFIAFMPVVESVFVSAREETPVWLRATSLITVLAMFGWAMLARLLRSEVLSLREREFVAAARLAGASPAHIVIKELLPNLWSPIIIQSTLLLPMFVTAEAGLSFLGVGMTEPTPDWGRMIERGAEVYRDDIMFLLFPGVAMMIFVLACNILGDSVRDALNPRW